MYAKLTIEAIDYTQELELTPEQLQAELTIWAQNVCMEVNGSMSTSVSEFFLGNYIKGDKGDPGSGSTKKIEFTTTDWVSIAGGYELSLVHGLEAEVHTEIYSSGVEILCDKIPFNTNTIKLRVPIDYRFEGYAIIKN